jgi:hypothetical protein
MADHHHNHFTMERWFLMSFKVQKDIYLAQGKIVKSRGILTELRLIQAQTEKEAVAKFELELKPNEKYLSHDNQTIL